MKRKIVIGNGTIEFSSAHFIILNGICEPLHGHNYGMSVEISGELNHDALIFDFIEFKKIMRALCKTIDHRVLLPEKNQELILKENEREYEIHWHDIRYIFPKSSVIVLPVDNVTAERLAEYLANQLVLELKKLNIKNIESLMVGVQETSMQTAFYTVDISF